MKKRCMIISFLILLLCGCNTITNDDLIGGTWHPTDGDGNGKIKGKPNCEKFDNEIQFANDEKFIALDPDRIYEYKLTKDGSQNNLYLNNPRTSIPHYYVIDKVSKNEIVFKEGGFPDNFSCHMERSP